jgi:hypothetical protein
MTKPRASHRSKKVRSKFNHSLIWLVVGDNKYWNEKANRLRARFEKYR